MRLGTLPELNPLNSTEPGFQRRNWIRQHPKLMVLQEPNSYQDQGGTYTSPKYTILNQVPRDVFQESFSIPLQAKSNLSVLTFFSLGAPADKKRII